MTVSWNPCNKWTKSSSPSTQYKDCKNIAVSQPQCLCWIWHHVVVMYGNNTSHKYWHCLITNALESCCLLIPMPAVSSNIT